MRSKLIKYLHSNGVTNGDQIVQIGLAYRIYDLEEQDKLTELLINEIERISTSIQADEAIKLAYIFGRIIDEKTLEILDRVVGVDIDSLETSMVVDALIAFSQTKVPVRPKFISLCFSKLNGKLD